MVPGVNSIAALLRVAVVVAPVWVASGCRSADQDTPTPSASPPSSFAAEEGLHFADVTREAEIDFVHSIGDGHLSNLVESSGGGVAFLDYATRMAISISTWPTAPSLKG